MARDIFSLVGRIRTEGFEPLQKKLAAADKSFTKVANKVNAFGANMVKAGTNITKLTAPLIGMGVAAVKFGADFDKAMTNSLAIMGDLTDGMRKDMEMAARSVAKTTTFSAAQAAEAYYFLASAGLSAAQSIEALPRVAKFAQAGAFDLALATDLLTDAQSALGLSSKDAAENMTNMTRVSDVLVKANTLANASVQQFSEALTNKAGAALRVLNKDVEEGVAVLSVFADQGLKGSAAGDALNIVLRDLQVAALKNKDAFAAAGVSVFDQNGKMRNMADIVGMLETRLAGMSDEQRRAELSALGFQDRSVAVTMGLLGTSKQIAKYQQELKGAAGITDEVANKQLKHFWAQLTLVKNRLVDVALTIHKALSPVIENTLMPALDKVVKSVEAVASWFDGLNGTLKTAIVVVLGVVAAVGPMLIIIGKAIQMVKVASIAFQTLNAVMIANPIGLIITGIGLLVIAGIALYKNWDTVVAALGSAWTWMRNTAVDVFDSIRVAILNGLQAVIGFAQTIGKFIPGVNALLESAKNKMADMSEEIAENKRQRAILREEEKLAKRQTEELTAVVEAAKTETVDYTGAVDDLVDTKKADVKATGEQIDKEAELLKSRQSFESDWAGTVRESTMTRAQLLDWEYQTALSKADDLGANKADIELHYNVQRMKMEDEAKKHESDLRKQGVEEEKAARAEVANMALSAVDMLISLGSMETDTKLAQLDEQTAAKRQQVEDMVLSDEEKEARIAAIDEDADEKKRELMLKQAKRDKAAAIFAAIINTFQAVSKALTLGAPVGIIMAAIMGALGVAQIAMIAARPLPQLAEGAMVKKRPGGVQAVIGEGGDDEVVLPMKLGAAELAKRIMGGLTEMFSGGPELPMALAGGGSLPTPGGAFNGGNISLHIGTLIADDSGLRNLERTLFKFRAQEQNRRGE